MIGKRITLSVELYEIIGTVGPGLPVSAIFTLDDLPEKWHSYIEKNANYATGGKFQADTYKAA